MKCPHCDKNLEGQLACGNVRSYTAGCRCDECRKVMSAYQKDRYKNGYRRPSRRPGSRFGDASPASASIPIRPDNTASNIPYPPIKDITKGPFTCE